MIFSSNQRDKIKEAASKLNLECNSELTNKIEKFVGLLTKWGRVHNLTAILQVDKILSEHIFDSWAISDYIYGDVVVDVGTGAGFPGIPLALLYPEKRFFLVECNQKKANFLRQAKLELKLQNIEVIDSRCEDCVVSPQPTTIVSRAFTSLSSFYQQTRHLAKSQTKFVAMKGVVPEGELKEMSSFPVSCEVQKIDAPYVEGKRCVVVFIEEREGVLQHE